MAALTLRAKKSPERECGEELFFLGEAAADQGGQRIEGTKPYQYGDSVSELDLYTTLHNALTRHGLPRAVASSQSPAARLEEMLAR